MPRVELRVTAAAADVSLNLAELFVLPVEVLHMENEGTNVIPIVSVGYVWNEENLSVFALRADMGRSHGARD